MYVTLAGEPLLAYLLASVRIVAWLVVVPPFSTRAVPTAAKVVLRQAGGNIAWPGILRKLDRLDPGWRT